MRWKTLASAATITAAVIGGGIAVGDVGQSDVATTERYVVLYDSAQTAAAARTSISSAGGTVVQENSAIGLAMVTSNNDGFAAEVSSAAGIDGAAADRSIGRLPAASDAKRDDLEQGEVATLGEGPAQASDGLSTQILGRSAEPLAGLQWDMDAIHAPQAHDVTAGDKGVTVGVIDTGIDGSHPDIAPNFNAELSRNFTVDDPIIDGPCAEDPDGLCTDPSNVDEDGHGTHVAGTIASPINSVGIAGVAPNVTLVNLRAGQDSGYFFLKPSVDALTYAGDHGIDVVNMSYYIDPWLYNCTANPADSKEAQAEQRTIIRATQRALTYARNRGVTLVSALGNEATDMGNPTSDETSPDYPPDVAYPRTVDNSCLDLPAEGRGVIGVSSTGPSGRKSYFSNYGTEQTDVSAPGGDRRDFFGTDKYLSFENTVLAPYPTALAVKNEELNPDGTPNTPSVVRFCDALGVCSYYQYLQGTSMASPHAAGVVALIVSRYGKRDRRNGGLTLRPSTVERILYGSATDTPCPDPPLQTYPDRDATYNALCVGTPASNGFYGNGLVDALTSVNSPYAPNPGDEGPKGKG